MTPEEKVLILGSLFHDIGKFEQRCTCNPYKLSHDHLGSEFISSGRFQHRFENIVGKENFPSLINIVEGHHNKDSYGLTQITQTADHLSASERVEAEKNEENKINWKYKHLASLFTKINLFSDQKLSARYYRHSVLTGKDYNIIIPKELTDEEINSKEYTYTPKHFEDFKSELEAVLDFYKEEDDFCSLINLLLILLEKWLWCIPDFTGSPETDISLYNHLKDVAGISHALYLTKKENAESNSLNLIIGDLPGIQKYIFDVVNKKPAKVLRGRSIFIQILTRNFASLFLNECGLTEANLIMLAGGKFYIVAPDTAKFESDFKQVQSKIEEYLFEEFRMDLGFNSTFYTFNYSLLKKKKITFGQIIEEASYKLLQNRNLLFKNKLFAKGEIDNKNFIWKEEYINNSGSGTDSIKCDITDKPIREGRSKTIKDAEDKLIVDKQVKNEYEIGSKITGDNLLVIMNQDNLSINPDNIVRIKPNLKLSSSPKLMINPDINFLLNKEIDRQIFKNASYLEVANYCSSNDNDVYSVLPFEERVKVNKGAKYLSLIKGDIDNLGLIMAYGLTEDVNDLTAISRTTTLSNHLKYYFSFFLNGFLEDWEKKDKENKVYTIFAGGDDLMLIAPQNSALKLVNEFNKKYQEFVCDNCEVHISYSITNFKDHSPIRIVADIAEENQKQGKEKTKEKQKLLLDNQDNNSFSFINDKAGTFLFNSFIKNSELDYFLQNSNIVTSWVTNNELSHGLVRKILELAEMTNKYEDTKDATYLIGYARSTHSVNRAKIKNTDIDIFLHKKVLKINTENDPEAAKLKSILLPLICQVIYNTRN